MARCRCSPQQSLRTQIFVNFRPMNPVSTADDLPLRPLLGGRVEQPGKPYEGHGDRTSIEQVDAERVLLEAHVLDALIWPNLRNSHATPPTRPRRTRRRSARSHAAPWG